jgi:serine protease Do
MSLRHCNVAGETASVQCVTTVPVDDCLKQAISSQTQRGDILMRGDVTNTKRFRRPAGALSLLAGALLLSAAVLTFQSPFAFGGAAPSGQASEHSLQHANSLSEAFRGASNKVMPAVVMIKTTAAPMQMTGQPGMGQQEIPEELLNNPMLRRFFGEIPDLRNAPQSPQRSGMGSGVIIDPSGIILTNNHVVKGGGTVTVRLHDGREFEATDVRTDPGSDIAVVRIDADGDLPFASTGNSDQLQIGDWVIAVGSPFGLHETVTAGIISAKSRGIGITERENFLQTDAAINPGNSGGPLVNLNGDVIGINTAISSTSGGYQGIGFAIPINMATWIGDQLATNGTVQRAFLGVAVQEVTLPLSHQLGMDGERGALVNDVRPDSPAAKAGLAAGDVVVSFDDQAVTGPRDLQRIVERAKLKAGHTVVVFRDGERLTLNAHVDQMTDNSPSAGSRSTPATTKMGGYGLQLAELDDAVAKQLGMKTSSGVLITDVMTGSAAEQAGLQSGMVITKVGTQFVSSLSELQDEIEKQKTDDGILLLVQTGDVSRFVVLKENG